LPRPWRWRHRRAHAGRHSSDLKIDWFERLFTGIKQRFPQIWLHCLSASEVLAIAEYSELSLRDTIAGCATRASTRSPAAARRFWTTTCASASRA